MRDPLVALLEPHLADYRERDFVYGQSDCVIFVAGWIKLATGRDALDGASWTDLATGMDVLKTLGFADWCEAVGSVLEERPPMMAQLGDIVAARGNLGLGICLGVRCAFLNPERGLTMLVITDCARAWSIECPL